MSIRCCNKQIENCDLWLLKDIKGFTARKIYIGKCKNCKTENVLLCEKRIIDNKTFVNQFKGIDAIKTIYREKKRIITTFPNIKSSALFGFVYGVNKEIRNKKGEVTQIRQYSTDFKTNKKILTKTLIKP